MGACGFVDALWIIPRLGLGFKLLLYLSFGMGFGGRLREEGVVCSCMLFFYLLVMGFGARGPKRVFEGGSPQLNVSKCKKIAKSAKVCDLFASEQVCLFWLVFK